MAREVTPEQIEMLDALVARARKAADIIATYDQARVDRLCQAVAAAVVDMKVWANLADEAVDETGLGDKVTKRNKRNKLKLILRDCLRQKSVGVIEEIPEKGIVKYAKPVGVIASLVPTTHPCRCKSLYTTALAVSLRSGRIRISPSSAPSFIYI